LGVIQRDHHPVGLIAGVFPTFTQGQDTLGPVFGGQLGYNWQAGSWVFGVEGDEPNERAFAGEDKLFDVRERLQVYDLEEREMSFRRGRR
jgi:hypothetical protein